MKKLVVVCMCVSVIGFASITSAAEAKTPEIRKFKPKEIKMDRNYDGLVDRVEAYDEKGIIIRSETDTNNNGKMDEWVFYEKGIPVKAEKDTNGDGKANTFLTYDRKGVMIKSETDTDNDGKINEWVHYKKGVPVKAEKDTNKDGKPDNWIVY